MNSTLLQLDTEIAAALRALTAAQTQLRPSAHPEKWSIQQVVEHLLLTWSGTEAALNARIAKARPTRAEPSLWQRLGQIAVFRFGYFPTRRKAPASVTPAAEPAPRPGDQLTLAARDHLAEIDRLCTQGEELFGSTKPCIGHTVLGPLSLDHWRSFQLLHGQHHLRQILAIRKDHKV